MSEKVYPPLEGGQPPYPPAAGEPGVQVPMAPPSYDQTQAQGPPPAVPMGK